MRFNATKSRHPVSSWLAQFPRPRFFSFHHKRGIWLVNAQPAIIMMRQSMAPLRQSHVPGQPPNTAALAKLAEKKKEFEAVAALDRASAKFLRRIEDLGDDFEVMADAGTGRMSL